MVKSGWFDVSMRGRRLEAIAKLCNTEFWKHYEKNPSLAQSYFDRLMKIEYAIKPYIAEYTGVEKLLRDGKDRIKEISPELIRK